MTDPRQLHIVLGVTGGIAAYKSAELIRRLRERGAEVRVVMTEAAQAFITPLTLQALSGHPIHCALLDPGQEAAMGHIELARWADRVVVAPASADFMARLAHGLANDLLSALCLATQAPVVLAPAMNRLMWSNPATQANARLLQGRGIELLGPDTGSQACGETGPGRMLAPEAIAASLTDADDTPLLGRRVLVTAGPTREAIDPVRYLSNRSSGRMGYAVALAAAKAGAQVTLVSGPVRLDCPAGVERILVESAEEMHHEVMKQVDQADIFIAVAAVADYRIAAPATNKIKKNQASLSLEMVRNPDILAEVSAMDRRPFCVGFAAETEDVEAYAKDKLKRKNLDLIAANRVGTQHGGFESEDNALILLWPGGREDLGFAPKLHLAHRLITRVANLLGTKETP
ncbi:MAG: bifunctional phosphopantothenoylcysteine decarboxylase/phosphopantothenate--cysteine ligase CoaBC [Chromatiales bacterium]|nr:bifunctional phosphopantothenoylcysteine decarboxylase/phosphopantothenate--cysteine ligase CoaBC [Chromatiales bacterium]